MDKKSLLRKIILVPLILSMMCVYMPQFTYVAYAAGVIGSLNGTTYDDFDDLIDDLEDDYSGKTVTIEMLANWDADEDGDFNERLIIPSNCKATLNMNGHVFDRGETADNDSSFNGELITMESGSNLTINGGDTSVSHSERVYTSTDRDAKASTWKDFHGGVLTGGASDNGAGGIHVKSNCTLTMNDVTRHKPDPETAEAVLKKLAAHDGREWSDALRKEAIFIGDTKYDIGCAQNAGIDSVLVGWSHYVDEEDMAASGFAPTYKIKKPAELLELI